MKIFTESDIVHDHIVCLKTELADSPLWWHKRGLQQTASGYGSKLTTRWRINFLGRVYRVYCTCFGNAGTCWFNTRGRRISVSAH